MTTFDVQGRATAARYTLALLRLHLREQVLAREQARSPHPLVAGVLADLPMQIARAAIEQASVDVAAAANAAEAAGVRQDTEAALHRQLNPAIISNH